MELRVETTHDNAAVTSLIKEIERGVTMIGSLNEAEYSAVRHGETSIGAHIRHNLDFCNAFLNGIEVGRIDYNARARDPRVEVDACYAAEHMGGVAHRLGRLSTWNIGSLVLVRSEIDTRQWHTSSVLREIEFLHSHTVHHYALIKLLMQEAGSLDASFGVSPSTVRYRTASEAQLQNYSIDNYEIN